MQQPVRKAYVLVSKDPAEVQRSGALAAKMLSNILKTCLGPRAMQKMLLTKINSIELTNDGNFILREMDVAHPAVRSLIELCQTQEDECGDGTTSTIILSAELLSRTVELLSQYHPIRLCNALIEARDVALEHLRSICLPVAEKDIAPIVASSVATKICTALRVPIPELALKAALAVRTERGVDIKTDIKVEKILGDLDGSEVLDGIMFEKQLTHCQMRRRVENPKIFLTDSPLEYKKGESVTNYEFASTRDFTKAMVSEEEQIRRECSKIIEVRPDIVITEKGISDLALGILQEKDIVAFRRVKRSDIIRIAKATGSTVVNRIEDVEERHLGSAGLFEYVKINNNHYCKLTGCESPKAVSVVLRGPSMDILAELERNFMDAIKVAKNVLRSPLLVPGGGASEFGIGMRMRKEAQKEESDLKKAVYRACNDAFSTIPSILALNSGNSTGLEVLRELSVAQEKNACCGVNGVTGKVEDMKNVVMEPAIVKEQCVKSAFEAVMQLIRVDGIIECRSK